jgi:hypothetical protein
MQEHLRGRGELSRRRSAGGSENKGRSNSFGIEHPGTARALERGADEGDESWMFLEQTRGETGLLGIRGHAVADHAMPDFQDIFNSTVILGAGDDRGGSI